MANKPDNDLGIGCIVVILLVVGGVFEFLRSYWQIVLILAGTGAFVYFIFSGKEPEKKFIAENMKYEIKEGDTQLPSMPYSSVKPDEKIISEAKIFSYNPEIKAEKLTNEYIKFFVDEWGKNQSLWFSTSTGFTCITVK